MAKLWFLFLFSGAFIYVKVASTDLDIDAEYKDELCTTKLQSCSIKVDGNSLNTMTTAGEKGDRGLPGTNGEKGETGATGEMGMPGIPGTNGEKGPPGPQGEKGEKGEPGPEGTKGEQGETGDPGIFGQTGEKGDRGEQGSTGLRGPPGLPGLSGACHCVRPESAGGDAEPIKGVPQKVCKEDEELKGDVQIGPGPMKVTCKDEEEDDTVRHWTCIPPQAVVKITGDVPEEKSYWLSTKSVLLSDIYNLTHNQLSWIQDRSNKAYQKIKYTCKNSTPYSKTDEDHSLLLLSFNDITFGATPKETTPFVYEVPSETDECNQPTTGEPRSSIIKITSDSARRLPVVDFLIRDLRDVPADIGIEHLELCFL